MVSPLCRPSLDGRVQPWHDLGRHQLHRALAELLVHPVHAGVDQLAEIAHLLAQREKLVQHLLFVALGVRLGFTGL